MIIYQSNNAKYNKIRKKNKTDKIEVNSGNFSNLSVTLMFGGKRHA